MYSGVLIGYFGKQDEARKAFRQLHAKGYRRLAWASKNADGDVHVWDPFQWRRALAAVLAFILFGALAAIVSTSLAWPDPAVGGSRIPALVGGFIGVLLCLAWMRRLTFGVRRGLLEDHARWLVSGESVLILQAPIETLRVPVTVLLESGETQPAVFILYPKRESPNPGGLEPRDSSHSGAAPGASRRAWPQAISWSRVRRKTPSFSSGSNGAADGSTTSASTSR